MFRSSQVTFFTNAASSRAAWAYHAARSQPAWITRFALLAMLFIIGLPVLLLVVAAMLGGLLVFAVLLTFNSLLNVFRRRLPRNDGRQNVRVIQRAP